MLTTLMIATLLLGAAGVPSRSAHATINGVNYYYEVRGEGEPLLLLHGGLTSSSWFEPVVPVLARGRQVILVDLQGHGHTHLGNRPIRCETIADDVASLLKRMVHDKVAVLGYSFGGCVALRLAVQHPDRVRGLVLVSTPFAGDGWYLFISLWQRYRGLFCTDARLVAREEYREPRLRSCSAYPSEMPKP